MITVQAGSTTPDTTDTTLPTVTAAGYYSDEALTTALTGQQKAGASIYTKVAFSEDMKHAKGDAAAARPELFYRIGTTDTQYDILDNGDTLASGDCKPTDATETDEYVCLYTVGESDSDTFRVKVGTNSVDRANNALASAFTHYAAFLTLGPCPRANSTCVTSVEYASYPPNGEYYRAGDTIAVAVNFTGPDNVQALTRDGALAPDADRMWLNLDIGGVQTLAQLAAGVRTQRLIFTYIVDETDSDADGFTVLGGYDGDLSVWNQSIVIPDKSKIQEFYIEENIDLRLRNIDSSGQSNQVVRGFDDIWTATLTAKRVSDSRGCDGNSGSQDERCPGLLSPRSFTYRGTSYTVTSLHYDFTGSLRGRLLIGFDKAVPWSVRDTLTLLLGDKEFDLSSGSWDEGNLHLTWNDSGLSWWNNQRVAVKLTAPNGPVDRRYEDRRYVEEVTCEADGARCWVPRGWDLIPKRLSPKNAPFPFFDFRLMFVTDATKATERNISAYNAFVRGQTGYHEALEGLMPYMRAMANAAEGDDLWTNTRTHVPTPGDNNPGAPGAWAPIYWVNGLKIADSYADLFDGGWATSKGSGMVSLVSGTAQNATAWKIWTGSRSDGSAVDGSRLGDGTVEYGSPQHWQYELGPVGKAKSRTQTKGTKNSLYAITPLLTISRPAYHPGAPTGFTAGEGTGEDDDKIVLSWDAPPRPGLTRYQYRRGVGSWNDLTGIEKGDTRWSVTWTHFPATDTRGERPLESDTYQYSLRAVSVEDDRLRSAAVSSAEFTLTIDPAEVTNVEITSRPVIGNTYQVGETVQAAVSFSRPVRWNGRGGMHLRFLSGQDPQKELKMPIRDFAHVWTDRLDFEIAVPERFSTPSNLALERAKCLVLKGKATITDADDNKIERTSENKGEIACGGATPVQFLKHRVGTPTAPVVMVDANSPIAPSGLTSGSKFRLLFVSSYYAPTTWSDIHRYNDWVQQLFKDNSSLYPHREHFRAVVSTRTVDARANIAMTDDAPVYWVGGAKVADNVSVFCSGTGWQSHAAEDETGNRYDIGPRVMTGSNLGCVKDRNGAYAGNLGNINGDRFGVTSGWVDGRYNAIAAGFPMHAATMQVYGLSLVFQVK